MPNFKHVTYSWDDSHAASLDAVDRLVYRSNILGADQRITNTGGGNTSSKIMETDPLTGQQTEVLWVKGSGGDLRTSKRENFSSLYQDKLIGLQSVYAAKSSNGLKTAAEDEMVGMYFHTTFNLNPRPSSIDTPLHSFLTGKHVDHMHPNAIIAIAASKNCEALTKEIFEGEMEYVPWMRPGFELGLAMQEIEKAKPTTQAIMMGQHGFISWDDDDKKCYELTLRLIDKAAQYIQDKYEAKGGDAKVFGGAETPDPTRRGAPCDTRWNPAMAARPGLPTEAFHRHDTGRRKDPPFRELSRRPAPRRARNLLPGSFPPHQDKAALHRMGSTAGRSRRTEEKLAAGLLEYREDYAKYYATCRHENSPAMRDPNPTVVLIPGLGMIAWGKDKSESASRPSSTTARSR